MNSCILMAEIIKNPELRYTPDNQMAVADMFVQFAPPLGNRTMIDIPRSKLSAGAI